VISALQGFRVPAVAQGERAGAMAADVVKCAQSDIFAAHDQHGFSRDIAHHVIARCEQITAMRSELPACTEHVFLFVLQPVVVGVELRVQCVRNFECDRFKCR